MQNWDIDQADNGLIYFANNDGLLEFDGHNWEAFPLPNKTILRSIHIKDDVIYAGGQNEFGRYIFDVDKRWRFVSLKDRIPVAHTPFDDVWDLFEVNGKLFFRSNERIYILDENEAVTVLDHIPVFFLGVANERVFTQHIKGQLYEWLGDEFQAILNSEDLIGTEIRKIIPNGEDFLIATYKKGLFLLTDKGVEPWKGFDHKAQGAPFITKIHRSNNGNIVIATAFEGALMVDQDGKFKYQLMTSDGLPNNNVICTFIDRDKNLWLGLDNGISIINISTPFSRVLPNGPQDGPGYAVKVFRDKVYFGTSSGLFYADWDPEATLNSFKKVENCDGQVWGLDVIKDQLVMSHADGAFLVENSQAQPFDNIGSWLFRSCKNAPELTYSGNYNGIAFWDSNTFDKQRSVSDLSKSSRFIEEDRKGDLWMSHPYLGIYRVVNPGIPDSQHVVHLGASAGLPSNLHNHIFNIYGQIIVAAEQGVYVFNTEKNVFEIHSTLTEYFGPSTKVRRLVEAGNGDVWYVTTQEVGVLKIAEKGLKTNRVQKISFPELSNMMIGGWEKIYPLSNEHVFINTTNGFLHYDGSIDHKTHFDVLLKNIHVNESSIIQLNDAIDLDGDLEYTFSPNQNALGFELAATQYYNNEYVSFQYYLKGFDTDWTPFTKLRFKEYLNLPSGNYTLHIRAKQQSGRLSEVKTIGIHIQTSWYRTYPALAMYLLLLSIAAVALYRWSSNRYEELEQKVGATIEKSKEEVERLETEKIQVQLEHKKRELVSSTMHLMKKNETIIELADNLTTIMNQAQDDSIKLRLGKLIRVLRQEGVQDDSWEQIMYHFSELHKGFFDKLKQDYPALTPKDLRLSAYMKMNLTSKEIATLMNLSVRGIEASRYRLRKKLNLDSEVNLNEFFMSFE
ncbi:MAG: triple tyrosine motif-containing protein [Bacteroidia bacterium]